MLTCLNRQESTGWKSRKRLFNSRPPRRVRAKMMKEDPTLVEDWDEKVGDRMIKVVFIGHDMDKEAIIKSLDDCLAY